MTQPPRRRLFGNAAQPSITEEIPRGVRVAASWSWRLLLIAALAAVTIWAILALREIVIPVLIALLVASLLVPFVHFLQRHRWPRWLSVASAFLSLLVIVSGLLMLWITQVARASEDITAQTQRAWAQWSQVLADSPLHISQNQLNAWFAATLQTFQSDTGSWLNGALSVGSTVTHVLAGLLLTLFSTLFFLIDGRGIWSWIVRLMPARARQPLDGAGRAGWSTLTSFVRVQILVAFVDGLGIGIGAAILGIPLAIPIGIMVFLGSFIPIVGAVVTGAIAAFIALVYSGPVIALIMLGIVLLVQQIEGHVMQPLVMGSAVKVHPLAVVLVVAAGSFLGGIAGALFAVPVVATLNVMIGYLVRRGWESDAEPAGRTELWTLEPTRPPGAHS